MAPEAPADGSVSPDLLRTAAALGIAPERLARALEEHGVKAEQLHDLVRAGTSDERLLAIARSLRVGQGMLAAAVLEAAAGAPIAEKVGQYAEGVATAIRGTAEEALGIALEILGESVPKLLNNVLAVLALAGAAFVALGLLAIFATTIFVQLLAILAGLVLVGLGAAMFLLAWRLHEATAIVRTVAKVAKRMRERQRARADADAEQAAP
ncbi:MAG TPA: hypothetical protein VGR28_01740 [Candidatus Thermoplasmatota archaeon]|jgi:hypothetical protein|nr:hypothetical protein [Candidatus Thermoplasmatota archaeon]